jgi:hypothetical protein
MRLVEKLWGFHNQQLYVTKRTPRYFACPDLVGWAEFFEHLQALVPVTSQRCFR